MVDNTTEGGGLIMARHFVKRVMNYSEINDFLEKKAKYLKNVTPFYVSNSTSGEFDNVVVHYFYDD